MDQSINYQPYKRSQQLYQPLRNALKKSAHFPQPVPFHRDPINNYLDSSGVVKASRSMSSSQAQYIKASTIFANDKTFIPTNHFEKIIGKKFKTVDVQQTFKKPISQNQFLHLKTLGHQEIVYEFPESNEINKIYTYTTAHPTNNTLPSSQSNHSSNKFYEDKDNSKFRAFGPIFNRQLKTNFSTYQTVNTSHYYQNQQIMYSNHYHQMQGQQGMVFKDNSKVTGKALLDLKSASVPQQFSYHMNQRQNEIVIQPQQLKPYKFEKRQMMIYEDSSKGISSIDTKSNLFNMFDGCINNGCDGKNWQSNQICASKIAPSRWK